MERVLLASGDMEQHEVERMSAALAGHDAKVHFSPSFSLFDTDAEARQNRSLPEAFDKLQAASLKEAHGVDPSMALLLKLVKGLK